MALDLVARLSLRDDFSSRMRGVERQTRSATSGFKSLTTAMGGVAAGIGITAALAGGMNMLKSSIDGAFSRIDTMEAFDRTMTVLTGSAEDTAKALEATREAVTGTAYGLDVAAKGVQNFVTRGVEIGKATKYVTAWGDAVAFYGEGSNEQLSTVMDALGKMTSTGKVSMDQMNRLYDVGIDGVGMYAKAVGKDVGSVQKALSKGSISSTEFIDVVTEAMMSGTNGVVKISGAAKEAGATWDAAFANMKAAVTRGVTTIIQTIDKLLTENGLPTMRDMVSAFGKKFESVLNGAAGAIQPFIDKLKMAYNEIKPIIPMLKEIGKAIGVAAIAVAGFTVAISIFQKIAAAALFLISPFGLIIASISALAIGFYVAYKKIEPFRKIIDNMIVSVKGLFSILSGGDELKSVSIMRKAGFSMDQVREVEAFADRVKAAVGKVTSYIKGVATAFSTGDTGGILAALGFSPAAIGGITGFIDNVKANIADLKTFLAGKWAEMQPGIQTIISAFKSGGELIASIFKTVLSVLSPIFDALVVAFKIVADAAVIVFSNVIAPALGFVMSLFKVLWKVVGPILTLIGAYIGATFGVLKLMWDSVLKPIAAWLLGTFKTAFEAAIPYIERLGTSFDNIGGFISGVTDKLKTFSTFLKGIKIPDWVSNIGGKIAGAASWVGGAISGGGNAKSNYHGIDYVPYNGMQTVLHKGESVITAQENRENKANGSGGGVMITGNTFNVRKESDIDDIADQLYRKWSVAAAGGA